MNSQFFLSSLLFLTAATSYAASNPVDVVCKKHLAKNVCVTTADENDISAEYTGVVCAENNKVFVDQIMEWKNLMPPEAQSVLCGLKKIFISDSIDSLEFTDVIRDSNDQVTGAYIGIQKQLFALKPSIHDIATWKEQSGVFGIGSGYLKNNPNFPQVDYGIKTSNSKANGLLYVVLHELGHVVDFYNQISHENSPFKMPFGQAKLSWDQLSWNGKFAASGYGYLNQDKTCWDGGCGRRPASDIAHAGTFYQSLRDSAFVTSYAGFNSVEDFAETWAWRIAIRDLHASYTVSLANGDVVNMNSMFTQNGKIRRKLQFVDEALAGHRLKLVP